MAFTKRRFESAGVKKQNLDVEPLARVSGVRTPTGVCCCVVLVPTPAGSAPLLPDGCANDQETLTRGLRCTASSHERLLALVLTFAHSVTYSPDMMCSRFSSKRAFTMSAAPSKWVPSRGAGYLCWGHDSTIPYVRQTRQACAQCHTPVSQCSEAHVVPLQGKFVLA